MDGHIDGVLQLTHRAVLHSIENKDSMHQRVATTYDVVEVSMFRDLPC